MGWTSSNPVSVDEATKEDDYDAIWDNAVALKACRLITPMGGSNVMTVTDTSYVVLPASSYIAIDGTDLSGIYVQFEFMGRVESGTGYARLYNNTLTAAVASSEVTFTNTAIARQSVGGLTLNTANNVYRVEIKGSVAGALPRVYGARIVFY